MKQIVVLLATFFLFGINTYAQNDSKVKGFKDNIAKSNAAIQDAKKSLAPKTWMDRGKLFQDVYGLNVNLLRFGLTSTEAKLFFKEPTQILTMEVDGVQHVVYEYSQIELTFADDGLIHWKETQKIEDNPLNEAVKSYGKAASLDEKGKLTKKINEAYATIVRDLEVKCLNDYYNQNYNDAYQAVRLKIDLNKLLGVSDTIGYYQAGVFAYSQSEIDKSMWREVESNFNEAIGLGYQEADDVKGRINQMLYEASTAQGDTVKALKYAETGLQKYPNSLTLIYVMVNHYLHLNNSQEALRYILKAKDGDPTNASLYYAEGSLYERLGEPDKAIAAYDEAIAIDPKISGTYNPYYNKAVTIFNVAAKMMDDANTAKTNAEFEQKKDVAENEFMKAIPPLEKALEMNPTDRDVMDILKTLYYRLRIKYPELETKYNDITKKIEAM